MTEAVINVSALMIPLAAAMVSLIGFIVVSISHIYKQNEKLAKASAENKRLKEKIRNIEKTSKSLVSHIEKAIEEFNINFGDSDATEWIDSGKYSVEGMLEKLGNNWYSIGHVDGQLATLEEITGPEETKDQEKSNET